MNRIVRIGSNPVVVSAEAREPITAEEQITLERAGFKPVVRWQRDGRAALTTEQALACVALENKRRN